MADNSRANKKPISADWLVQGVLTKLGDAFDRLLGRGWRPSSSLATSELAERLKALMDAEARETPDGRKYVPHNIALKMQWDKFSTDAEEPLRKLEHELLTAVVDHINDRRYYTHAPISLTVKPDYFIHGVKLFVSFDKAEEEREVSLDVTAPSLNVEMPAAADGPKAAIAGLGLAVRYEIDGRPHEKVLKLEPGERLSIGRTRENDIALDDPSVSKLHAALLLNRHGDLVVSDTGSTNGTFVDDERIAYGKGVTVSAGQKLCFGTVDVVLEVIERVEVPPPADAAVEAGGDETVKIGEFEFFSKPGDAAADLKPAPTLPSVPISESDLPKTVLAEEPERDRLNGSEEPEVSQNK